MYLYNKVTFIVIATFYVHQIYCFNSFEHVDIQEVESGRNVILHCKSNDDNHNFMFWHLFNTGTVIGPKNDFNTNKFKYEILTGNLTIRAVTSNEVGLYTCVSDGVDKRDISVHSVNLVLKDWEDNQDSIVPSKTTNNNNGGNLWKVSAILGSIFMLLVIILVALHIYHKQIEKPNYFDIIEQNDDDEDSTEELFTREPSTSGTKTVSNKNGTSDNFKKVFTAINMKKT